MLKIGRFGALSMVFSFSQLLILLSLLFALFIFVKIANTIIRKEEPEEEIDTNTVLLTEIRDLLKQINKSKRLGHKVLIVKKTISIEII